MCLCCRACLQHLGCETRQRDEGHIGSQKKFEQLWSIERKAICGSDHLARQRMIQSLKRALRNSRVCFHLSVQGLEIKMLAPRTF